MGNPTNWSDFDRVDPITPIFKPEDELNGTENEYSVYSRSPSQIWNPVGYVHRWNQSNNSYALSSSAYLEIKPIRDLIFRSQFSIDLDTEFPIRLHRILLLMQLMNFRRTTSSRVTNPLIVIEFAEYIDIPKNFCK